MKYVHSIDNVIINYYLKCSIKYALSRLNELGSSKYDYWEKLDCSACVKWSFYQNHIHFDKGIYLKLGHYHLYDSKKKEFNLLPMISVEVNPNKHFGKDSYRDILEFIQNECTSGYIVRYDYAIDIPCNLNDLQVLNTRKEKGLYKGTRYYGQRNKHGFCRIYDKAKESGLDNSLTRIEHIFEYSHDFSFTEFYIKKENDTVNLDGLSNVLTCIVDMARTLQCMNVDYSSYLQGLDKRTRLKVEKALSGSFEQYKYREDVVLELLDRVKKEFFLDDNEKDSSNEFISIDDLPDCEIPEWLKEELKGN